MTVLERGIPPCSRRRRLRRNHLDEWDDWEASQDGSAEVASRQIRSALSVARSSRIGRKSLRCALCSSGAACPSMRVMSKRCLLNFWLLRSTLLARARWGERGGPGPFLFSVNLLDVVACFRCMFRVPVQLRRVTAFFKRWQPRRTFSFLPAVYNDAVTSNYQEGAWTCVLDLRRHGTQYFEQSVRANEKDLRDV